MLNTKERLSDGSDFEAPFREKLSDLDGVPPENGWPAIEAALDNDRYDRRWYLLLLLLLLVGTGGFMAGYWVSWQTRAAGVTKTHDAVLDDGRMATAGDPVYDGHQFAGDSCAEICEEDFTGGHTSVEEIQAAADASQLARAASGGGYLPADMTRATGENRPAPHDIVSAQTEVADSVRHMGNASRVPDNPRPKLAITPGDHARDTAYEMVNGAALAGNTYVAGPGAIDPWAADSARRAAELAALKGPDPEDSVAAEVGKRTPGRWTLQLTAGGSYVFKKITPSEDLYYLTDLSNKNEFSWHNAGYQVGARLRREVGPRTTLTAGVSWSRWQTSASYRYYDVVADSVVVKQITSSSIEVSTFFGQRSNEVRTTLHQVGLSVGVLQRVRILRHAHTVLLDFNLHQKIYSSTCSGQAGHGVEVYPTRFSVRAGVEKTVDIDGRWRLTLAPYVQRYLGSLYTPGSLFQFDPLQVGLDVGVLIPFRK